MDKTRIKYISTAGLIAAVYTLLALVFMPISFGVYQVRIAEALTILPFLTPAAIPGLFVGCLVSNVIGSMGWLDITLGSLLTLAAFMAAKELFKDDKLALLAALLAATHPYLIRISNNLFTLHS